MHMREDIDRIQNCITNRLDVTRIGEQRIAGIIGDSPSHYSKSPDLWNAAFRVLGMNATYLPFDVNDQRLGDLISALKDSDRFMGVNVTVPHKVRIINFLDQLDPGAERIQAVNTIVKTSTGRLMGYNTDGEGFVESILTPQPGQQESFLKSLKGIDVLLLGAGGSARAVAFHVSDQLEGGKLLICNRTPENALCLAEDIRKATGQTARAITEDEISFWAPKVGLIINSTTKGQGGIRKVSMGTATSLEPYSSLAPAHAPAFTEVDYSRPDFQKQWLAAAQADIHANNQASMALASTVPQNVRFYDLIYYPEETVFLRHGRLTGHRTMNGKAMIVNQAAIAFCKRICRAEIQAREIANPETSRRILETMYRAW